jgi:hypothetical protein
MHTQEFPFSLKYKTSDYRKVQVPLTFAPWRHTLHACR